jgi:hypothetical protein
MFARFKYLPFLDQAPPHILQCSHALQHYTVAAELDPTDMVYPLNISAVHLETKDFDKSIEIALRAAEIGEANQAPYETIGKAYARASKAAIGKEDVSAGHILPRANYYDGIFLTLTAVSLLLPAFSLSSCSPRPSLSRRISSSVRR